MTVKYSNEILRRLRMTTGLTQKDLAEVLGCTSQNVHRIEHGLVNLYYDDACLLADEFGVGVEYFRDNNGKHHLLQLSEEDLLAQQKATRKMIGE